MSFDHTAFVAALKTRFPELVEDLEDETWAGLLHLETGCFARYARAAIDRGDREAVDRCWAFANAVYDDCTADVENAILVSFLEDLYFEDRTIKRRWALDLMPEALRDGWYKMQRYNERISNAPAPASTGGSRPKEPKTSR